MWISKPIYESLPYFYLVTGCLALAASIYLDHWYWPSICFATGLGCLVGGLTLFLIRRDHRTDNRRSSGDQDV